MAATPRNKLLTIRAPWKLCDKVQRIATREGETASTIVRRLIRRGLDVEAGEPSRRGRQRRRPDAPQGEAA